MAEVLNNIQTYILNKIQEYFEQAKIYGKPPTDGALKFFLCNATSIDIVKAIIENPSALDSTDLEQEINKQWVRIVKKHNKDFGSNKRIHCEGGYDFFRYLSLKARENETQALKTVIENYVVTPATDEKLAIQSNQNLLSMVNTLIAKNEEIEGVYVLASARKYGNRYILIVKEESIGIKILITNSNFEIEQTIIEIDKIKNIENTIKEIDYKSEYLDWPINTFLYTPINVIGDILLNNVISNINNTDTNGTSNTSTSQNAGYKGVEEGALYAGNSMYSSIANTANDGLRAKEAERLTEEGVEQIVEEFANRIIAEHNAETTSDRDSETSTDTETNSDTSKKSTSILSLIEEAIEKRKKDRASKYKLTEVEPEYTTKDFYRTETIEKAKEILNNTHRLLITGCSGDGKTELAYLLAHELTGEPVRTCGSGTATRLNRVCIASAGDAQSLWSDFDESGYYGELQVFVKHIQESEIKEPCVFICNEIQSSDMRYLLGNSLWEAFNNDTTGLPENLYLIFTGCKDRDFGIDSQITRRVSSIELSYITTEESIREVREKIEAHFSTRADARSIIDTVANLNNKEGYQVISLSVLLKILSNSKNINFNVKEENLSTEGKQYYNELKRMAGGN